MCGIVGIVGRGAVAGQVVDALQRLAYRGYDSAGVATISGGRLERRRAAGKLENLELKLLQSPLSGAIGIGHTRWATHGCPSEANAHPQATDRLAVVHNGIIENFRELKSALVARGCVFESETDTEVVAQMVTLALRNGLRPLDAVRAVVPQLRGAFALAFLFNGEEDLLIGTRHGAPLALGYGEGEAYLGSDAIALAPFTSEISYLADGDCAVLSRGGVQIWDRHHNTVDRDRQQIKTQHYLVDKGPYRHFMLKEMHEQPEVAARTISHYIDVAGGRVRLPHADDLDFRQIGHLSIVGCGTAHYAGQVARYWFEEIAGFTVDVDIASEARYRIAPRHARSATLLISQSGETADTLASLLHSKAQGDLTVAIVNSPNSSIAREANIVIPTLAGPEIGVASTKAFTAQLTVLLCLAIFAARQTNRITADEERRLVDVLLQLPGALVETLNLEERIELIAHSISKAKKVIYIGRGTSYPLALEGALKLKEISYLHAEGFAAGELKHGPIALVEDTVPIVVLAPPDAVVEKTLSNMQEAAARGGNIVLVSSSVRDDEAGFDSVTHISMPIVDGAIAPIVYSVPLQLLAYHVAALLGSDIDQPRNLAKAVTVE